MRIFKRSKQGKQKPEEPKTPPLKLASTVVPEGYHNHYFEDDKQFYSHTIKYI